MSEYDIIETSIETLEFSDHTVALQRVEYPDRPKRNARVWRAQATDYFGEHIHPDNRVIAEDTSFYVAAAKAVDKYGNQGSDMEAGE